MDVRGTISAPTAAVDWIDIIAPGAFAEGNRGELLLRCDTDTRVAVGVPDPGTSTTAGSAVLANHASKVVLGSGVTHQSIWVQVPASQEPIDVQVDDMGADVVFPAGPMVSTDQPLYDFGIEDHNATNIALTPAAGARTQILNNGLGAFTNVAYKIPGRGSIWNTSTNQFDFLNAGLVLGDTVSMRLDFTVTTNSSNNGVVVELDLGIGGSPYTLTVASQDWRYVGTYNLVVFAHIYMGDTNTLNNPCQIIISSDTGGESITYNGHFVQYNLRSPGLV